MKFHADRDEAVSPVIATILLVALTVVLVAIVAVVMVGMANDIVPTKTVAATVLAGDGYATATVVSGNDVHQLTNFSLTLFNDGGTYTNLMDEGTGVELVGKILRVPASGKVSSGTYQYTITGNFSDGSSQVLSIGTITLTA